MPRTFIIEIIDEDGVTKTHCNFNSTPEGRAGATPQENAIADMLHKAFLIALHMGPIKPEGQGSGASKEEASQRADEAVARSKQVGNN